MIHIHVGPQKQKFLVHRQLLLESSRKICALFSKDDTKEETGIVRLPKEDPKVFSFAVDWIYQGQQRDFEPIGWNEKHLPLSMYLKLWMMGNRWHMTELQNFVMKQLHAWKIEAPKLLVVELGTVIATDKDIISGSDCNVTENKLAEWIVDMIRKHDYWDDSVLEQHGPDALDHKFLFELAKSGIGGLPIVDVTANPEGYLIGEEYEPVDEDEY